MGRAEMRVWVCVVGTDGSTRLAELHLPTGATAAQAVAASGLLATDDPAGTQARWAIDGRVIEPQTPLRDGDRVDVCAGLRVDPMQARRARAVASAQRGVKASSEADRRAVATRPASR